MAEKAEVKAEPNSELRKEMLQMALSARDHLEAAAVTVLAADIFFHYVMYAEVPAHDVDIEL